MRVIGLDGETYKNWPGIGHLFSEARRKSQSKLHQRCYEFVKKHYPLYDVFEEVYVPGSKLKLDMVIPGAMLIIEADGSQHQTFNPFFHKTKADFARAKRRDADKNRWCADNGFRVVRLDDGESEDEWKQKLLTLDTNPVT